MWFRPPRAIRPTREGWWFLLATFAIGLAATNTGNNLLYLILAMMLSFIVISGILSEQSFRGVEVRRMFPKRLYAGETASLTIAIKNRKRRLPSFSLHIQGPSPQASRYLLKLAPQGSVRLREQFHFERRGLHQVPGLKLMTRYPFGLFVKTSRQGPAEEVLVYPRVLPLSSSLIRALAGGLQACYQKGRESGLYDLRPYRDGDDFRLIHWRTSAKVGELMLKELEQEVGGRFTLLLEDPVPPFAEASLEEGIQLAASLASYLIRQGIQLRLITSNGTIPFGCGIDHLDRILTYLALYRPLSHEPPLERESNGGQVIRIRLGEGFPLREGQPSPLGLRSGRRPTATLFPASPRGR